MFMWLVVCLPFLFHLSCFGITIGSDTSVDRFNNQITLSNGDRIAGFAALQGGIKFDSALAQATFDSFFDVSGDIELNGGTLLLSRDLIFSNPTEIKTLGNITAQQHTVELAPTVTVMPASTENVCSVLLFTSITDIERIFAVDWSFDDRFIATGLDGVGAALATVANYNFDGSNVFLVGSELFSNLDIRCLRWHPTAYFIAAGRNGGSPRLLILQANSSTGALTQVSSDTIGTNVNAVGWHPINGSYLAVGTGQNSAEIHIYPVDGSGLLNAAGKITVDISPNRDVQQGALAWEVTGNYFAVGLNNSGSNPTLLIYQFSDQSGLSALLNASINTGTRIRGLDWNQTYTNVIAIGHNGNSGELIQLYRHDANAGTLTKITAVTDLNRPVYGVSWSQDGRCLAIGTNSGSNEELQTFLFDNDVETLTRVNAFETGSNTRAVRFDHINGFLATGNFSDLLSVYQPVGELLKKTVTFSDIRLILNSHILLQQTPIKFSGQSEINGMGNCLTFLPTSSLIIDRESSLLFKDITLDGLSLSNIQALDNSVTVTFENVTLLLDGTMTFSKGSFHILDDTHICGQGIFAYQSDQTSSIAKFAKLILDEGVTFSYDPPVASSTLLQFTDVSSELSLNGGTLHAAKALQLTKGTLTAFRRSFLSNDATTIADGISFGDGINAANDFNVIIDQLDILKGIVLYDNVT